MRPISTDKRNSIILLLQKGYSSRIIARKIGVGFRTVSRLRNKIEIDVPVNKGGRPKKISEKQKHKLVQLVRTGQVQNAVQLKKHLEIVDNTQVTAQTVRNCLKSCGFVARVKKKKPYLTQRHIGLRYEYAKRHIDWNIEDWENVVWSDEVKINMHSSDGRCWTWKKKGESFNSSDIQGTRKFGGGSIMAWGCMMGKTLGKLHRITGNMKTDDYISILQTSFMESLKIFGSSPQTCIFQQDGDPKHTAKKTMEWFSSNNIIVLDWPPQSPDMNVIEHVWYLVKKRLQCFEQPPCNKDELWDRTLQVWNSISPQDVDNIFKSLPNRIKCLYKAKGGYTKY